jgi:superfamily I DNA/RNA helicase
MGFLDAMNSSAVAQHSYQRELHPQNLKWIGTFHSIFLKILKEDIGQLGMKYNKNF